MYKELTLENLTKVMKDLTSNLSKKRKFQFICGKQGRIQMEKAFLEKLEVSVEEVDKKIKQLQLDLKEGVGYYFDGLNFTEFKY